MLMLTWHWPVPMGQHLSQREVEQCIPCTRAPPQAHTVLLHLFQGNLH